MYSIFLLYHASLRVWSWARDAPPTHSIEVSASLMRQQPTMHLPCCYLLCDYPIVSATGPHRRCLTVLRPVPYSERAVIFSQTAREMDSAAISLRTVGSHHYLWLSDTAQILSRKRVELSIVRKSRQVGHFNWIYFNDFYFNDGVSTIPFVSQRLIRGSLPKEYLLSHYCVTIIYYFFFLKKIVN